MKSDTPRTLYVPKSSSVSHYSKMMKLSAALLFSFSIPAQADNMNLRINESAATEMTQQNNISIKREEKALGYSGSYVVKVH